MQVMVGMSGGVDSSVAAARLRDEGYEVIGVTLRLWGGESDSGCCSVADVDDARRAADHLGVEHHVFNFADDFERHVVAPYAASHAAGLTPNPCIECNRHIKFGRLLDRAARLGLGLVATGHHARRVDLPDGTHRVGRGADPAKDQSYVVHMLTQADLSRIVFPIGGLTKTQVRAEAVALGLRVADKPDSQDVCFIRSDEGRRRFLADRIPLRSGRVVDSSGAELSHVAAVELITVGQRRGLGLHGSDGPRYVTEVDVESRVVTVGGPEDLLTSTTDVGAMTWARDPMRGRATAQCSAHGDAVPCEVVATAAPDTIEVRWAEPQPRVAPGQSVVLYDDDLVVGGGLALA